MGSLGLESHDERALRFLERDRAIAQHGLAAEAAVGDIHLAKFVDDDFLAVARVDQRNIFLQRELRRGLRALLVP